MEHRVDLESELLTVILKLKEIEAISKVLKISIDGGSFSKKHRPTREEIESVVSNIEKNTKEVIESLFCLKEKEEVQSA